MFVIYLEIVDGSRSFIGNTLRKDFDDNIKHKKDNVLVYA